MDMDERKIRILQAIVNDYIETAEPVGSRTIAKKYELGIGSATIRNEMADLEEMGYLEQIHSSSGRKPSDKGYRLYVDKLMKVPELTPEEEFMIKNQILNSALHEADKMIKQASCILSELTKLTCIVRTSSVKKSIIKNIQIFDIDGLNIICVIVTDNGVIRNSMIRLLRKVESEVLNKIGNLLNAKLKGLTIDDINLDVLVSLKRELNGYDEILNSVLTSLYETLKTVDATEIFTEGSTNIFNYPEYNNILKAKEFLSLIDNKERIKGLFNSSSEVTIKIGGENFLEEAKECSIISAVYSIDNKPCGTIGVIGPTRIPYSKIITILDKIVKEINNNIEN